MCSAEILVKEVTFQINRTICFTPACVGELGILRCQTLGSIVTTTVTQLFAKPSFFARKKPQVALFDGFMICTYIFNAFPLAIPWTLV